MAWLAAHRGAWCALTLGLALTVVVCGCSVIAGLSGSTAMPPTAEARQAATPEATVTGRVAASPLAPSATAATLAAAESRAAAPSSTPAPALPAALTDAQGLVYARGTSVLQTGYLGGEAHEVAVVPPYDSWSFQGGRLALALGPAVEVIDLLQGTQVSLQVGAAGDIEFAEVHWGLEEGTLLHVAWIADEGAPTYGRRVELRALSPADGRTVGQAVLPDVPSVSVLRYDDLAGTVTFITRGGDPSFAEVRTVDIRDGSTVATHAVQGEGEAALSPDGRWLLVSSSAGGTASLVLHNLVEGTSRSGPEIEVVSPVWSRNGRQVAFLTGQGGEAEQGLDLQVLDVETMQAQVVLAALGAHSLLAGWAPDGGHIVGYHRGEARGGDQNDAYVFTVRPDGGDRRILNLGADAVVLGWMPRLEAERPRVAVDPWPARFAQGQQDAAALAAAVAEYVLAHADQSDEELSAALGERLTVAGLQLDLAGPQVRRVDEGLYVAQLPPQQICLLEGGQAQRVVSGNLVIEARREGDMLGLIYGVIGAGAVQPAFVLLGRADDGTWTPRWSPQGQRDWIATDGEIRFEGEGLGALHVSGTSFGIDLGEEDAFVECHACPHRNLAATWVRDGQSYARQSDLPADATLSAIVWEMTTPEPYAVLYEALRRARAGEDAGDLATADALQQAKALGLLAPEVRLMPEEVEAEPGGATAPGGDGLVWFGGEGGRRYRATVQAGRLVALAAEND